MITIEQTRDRTEQGNRYEETQKIKHISKEIIHFPSVKTLQLQRRPVWLNCGWRNVHRHSPEKYFSSGKSITTKIEQCITATSVLSVIIADTIIIQCIFSGLCSLLVIGNHFFFLKYIYDK